MDQRGGKGGGGGAININLHFRSLLPSLSQTTNEKTRAVSFKIVWQTQWFDWFNKPKYLFS